MGRQRLVGAMAALVAVMGTGAGEAQAQGADLTCVLPLTKTDPATINIAYPDEAAIYWLAPYQAVPGARLRITGRYPHARYFSFNVYDQAQRPLDALADVEIAPDAGSSNPFVAGDDRTGVRRDYTAFVDFGPVPAKRAPNTMYTGTGQTPAPNVNGTFILRTYIPDRARDETGGVGLPTVTLEPATTPANARPGTSPCAAMSKPPVSGVNETVAASPGATPPEALTVPGQNPPHWLKFRNLVQVANFAATDNPYLDSFTDPASAAEPAGGNGAFLANLHNSYVYTALNRAYGDVSVTTVRAPTFPDTRPGTPRMPAAQLRYFSLCTNDFASQRFIACRTDDQSAIAADGLVRYVVSPGARPRWATAECGYTWLPSGPNTNSSLILRHMLPDGAFTQAIQRAEPRREAATMADFLPATQYVSGDQPCRATPRTSGPSLGLPASTRSRACTSRRSFTIHLDRRLRSATVRVAGRRVATRSGRRLRAPVNLRGLPRGTFRVTITGRTRAGRKITAVRTYRTCAARQRS